MKPILKYRGGKSKEIPNIEKFFPKEFDTYYEPFFGGGAVYFYLEPKKAVINDKNERLMDFYRCVKENYGIMRVQLDELQEIYEENQKEYESLKTDDNRVENKNEELYYQMRDVFNHKEESDLLDAVVYFFINKTAYSGMIRYNSDGEYNVPCGRYKNFNTKLITEEHQNLLSGAEIYSGDYSFLFSMAEENDFMFIDPPYDCIFNSYGNGGRFTEEDQERLAEEFRKLKCMALMVIGKTELTEKLYSDYIMAEYEKSYAVNIRNRFKSESKHLVVINY